MRNYLHVRVGIGTSLDQAFHHVQVTALARDEKWGAAVLQIASQKYRLVFVSQFVALIFGCLLGPIDTIGSIKYSLIV